MEFMEIWVWLKRFLCWKSGEMDEIFEIQGIQLLCQVNNEMLRLLQIVIVIVIVDYFLKYCSCKKPRF